MTYRGNDINRAVQNPLYGSNLDDRHKGIKHDGGMMKKGRTKNRDKR